METKQYETKREFVNRNQMSARELCIKNNHSIEYFDFEDSKGVKRTFATCGGRETSMYVTPNAVKLFEDTTISDDELLDKLQYFECCDKELVDTPNEKWVPCLAIVGQMTPAKRTLGLNLLRK